MGSLNELFKSVIALLEPKLDTFALHPCTVQADHGDGTLDVKPDNPKIPALVKVTAFTGIANVSVRVTAGSRVLLAFLGGNPNMPIVFEYHNATFQELKIGNATQGAARNGDTVQVTIPALAVQIAPNTPNPAPMVLEGRITSGSTKVLVE